jgi:hypothetical protein
VVVQSRTTARGAGVVVRSGAENINKEFSFSKAMADNMSIDKKEPERAEREGSEDSMDSTPEAEAGAPQENAGAQQKRKGGRKPVRYCLVVPPRFM